MRKKGRVQQRALALYEPVLFSVRCDVSMSNDEVFEVAVGLRKLGVTIQNILGRTRVIHAVANKVVFDGMHLGDPRVTIERE